MRYLGGLHRKLDRPVLSPLRSLFSIFNVYAKRIFRYTYTIMNLIILLKSLSNILDFEADSVPQSFFHIYMDFSTQLNYLGLGNRRRTPLWPWITQGINTFFCFSKFNIFNVYKIFMSKLSAGDKYYEDIINNSTLA